MESILAFLEPFISLIVTGLLIILVFLFVVKPTLNYIIVNRDIENQKKLAREYRDAKRQAEATRNEKIHADVTDWGINNPVTPNGEMAVKGSQNDAPEKSTG